MFVAFFISPAFLPKIPLRLSGTSYSILSDGFKPLSLRRSWIMRIASLIFPSSISSSVRLVSSFTSSFRFVSTTTFFTFISSFFKRKEKKGGKGSLDGRPFFKRHLFSFASFPVFLKKFFGNKRHDWSHKL